MWESKVYYLTKCVHLFIVLVMDPYLRGRLGQTYVDSYIPNHALKT